jgi:phage gpG-like protein
MPLPAIIGRAAGAALKNAAGASGGLGGGGGGKDVAVNVRGVKELQAALRQVETKLPRELRVAFNDAARSVVSRAGGQVPKRTGRLSSSVRAASTQRTGRVAMGSAAVPYAGFIEFGGRVGRNKSVNRQFVRRGRYLFPAAMRERDTVIRDLENALEGLIRRAGLS